MSDHADQSQDAIDLADRVAIQPVRNRTQYADRDTGQHWGEGIPAEHRQAVPWANTGATFQDILEHRQRVGQR